MDRAAAPANEPGVINRMGRLQSHCKGRFFLCLLQGPTPKVVLWLLFVYPKLKRLFDVTICRVELKILNQKPKGNYYLLLCSEVEVKRHLRHELQSPLQLWFLSALPKLAQHGAWLTVGNPKSCQGIYLRNSLLLETVSSEHGQRFCCRVSEPDDTS